MILAYVPARMDTFGQWVCGQAQKSIHSWHPGLVLMGQKTKKKKRAKNCILLPFGIFSKCLLISCCLPHYPLFWRRPTFSDERTWLRSLAVATPPVSLSVATATHCSGLFAGCMVRHMGMDQYLLITFLVGWTSIYQLFWCELQEYKVLTHPHMIFVCFYFLRGKSNSTARCLRMGS